LSVALPYLAGVAGSLIGALFTYFARRPSGDAQLRATFNDAFQAIMKASQDQHSADIVRISELDREGKIKDSLIESLQGDVRNLRQRVQSQEREVSRSGKP
jgi:hypothetical protein